MSVNLFAGARRLALLAAGAVVLIAFYVGMSERPFLAETYIKIDPNPFRANAERIPRCGNPWVAEYGSIETASGYEVTISMCAPTRKAATALVRAAKDIIPQEELQRLDHDGTRQLNERRLEIAKYAAVALGILFVATWSMGWVIRGFLGIPRGMDRKPESPAVGGDGGVR